MIERGHWKRNKEMDPERWILYGPQWQAECSWCHEMSDCFDTVDEQTTWIAHHRCVVATVRKEA